MPMEVKKKKTTRALLATAQVQSQTLPLAGIKPEASFGASVRWGSACLLGRLGVQLAPGHVFKCLVQTKGNTQQMEALEEALSPA